MLWLTIRRQRVTASGGEVGRLNTGGGTEVFLFFFFSLLFFIWSPKRNVCIFNFHESFSRYSSVTALAMYFVQHFDAFAFATETGLIS